MQNNKPRKTVKEAHDNRTVYIADNSMINHYCTNTIPLWNEVVDEVINTGGHIYVLPRTMEEFEKSPYSLPKGFMVLQSNEDIKPSLQLALDQLKQKLHNFDWNSHSCIKLRNDIMMLLEAGWYAAECLSLDEILSGKLFLITNNMKLIKKLLSSHLKREAFEDVVNNAGLEHFIQVRRCDAHGFIEDYSDDYQENKFDP